MSPSTRWLVRISEPNGFAVCTFRGLDALNGKNKSGGAGSLPMDTVVLALQDLIFYFRPPEEELEHEEKQSKLRSLKNRQNLFQEEVGFNIGQEGFLHHLCLHLRLQLLMLLPKATYNHSCTHQRWI